MKNKKPENDDREEDDGYSDSASPPQIFPPLKILLKTVCLMEAQKNLQPI